MKKVYALAGIFVGIPILLAASVALLIFLHHASASCTYSPLYTAISPGKVWQFQQVQKYCSDEDDVSIFFQLLRPGEPNKDSNTFLVDGDFHIPLNANHQIYEDTISILPKWLDDSNLLLIMPEDMSPKRNVDEVNGVHIDYETYPHDATKLQNPVSGHIFEKSITPEMEFKKADGYGLPGIDCELTIKGSDGDYVNNLSLHLTADQVFPVHALMPDGRKVLNRAYSGNSVQIWADKEVHRSLGYATSVEVDGFAPANDKSVAVFRTRHEPFWRGPIWNFVYDLKDSNDLFAVTDKIKQGSLKMNAAFWLDNAEVIYNFAKPNDLRAIDNFEQCIRTNNVFSVPPWDKRTASEPVP